MWIGVQAIALPASRYLDHHQWSKPQWVDEIYGYSIKLIYSRYGRKPIIFAKWINFDVKLYQHSTYASSWRGNIPNLFNDTDRQILHNYCTVFSTS